MGVEVVASWKRWVSEMGMGWVQLPPPAVVARLR